MQAGSGLPVAHDQTDVGGLRLLLGPVPQHLGGSPRRFEARRLKAQQVHSIIVADGPAILDHIEARPGHTGNHNRGRQRGEGSYHPIRRLPRLTEEKVGELLAELQVLYPFVTDMPKPPDYQPPPERRPGGGFDLADLEEPFDWDAPTGDQIAAYKASYEKWVADAHKIMLEAPSTWQDRFDVVLEKDLLNTGSEAAEDVRVSVGAL